MKETEKNTEKPYYEFHKSENRLKLNNISKEASTNVLHPENSLNIKEPALKNDVFNINEQVRLKYTLIQIYPWIFNTGYWYF